MKWVFALIYIISSGSLLAQVVVDESNNPIPFVNVLISSSKDLYLQTDITGKIPRNAKTSMNADDTLVFHHISFRDTSILRKNINDTIYLKRKAYNLSEVAIHSKAPKYQKMSACYRNLVIQDGHPIYYTDGEVDYLTKTKNISYKLFRRKYRVLVNKKIDKYVKYYKTEIAISDAYTPTPEKKYLPYQFIRKHDLILLSVDSLTLKILTVDSVVIGEIKEQVNTITYQLSNVFKLKSHKLLKTEVEIKEIYIYMVFRKAAQNNSLHEIRDFDNLLYFRYVSGASFKHDKEKVKRNVESVAEIFVENVSFIHEPDNEYSRASGMPRESNYTEEFWKACDCELYYPQNQVVFETMELR